MYTTASATNSNTRSSPLLSTRMLNENVWLYSQIKTPSKGTNKTNQTNSTNRPTKLTNFNGDLNNQIQLRDSNHNRIHKRRLKTPTQINSWNQIKTIGVTVSRNLGNDSL